MEGFDNLKAIQISIASPEQIRAWTHGVVKKPETINYRTHRPERDGLFCERIFGPTRDYECFCGKYKSLRYKGIICERCGVEITRSTERRERMGHIELVTPVAHIWYSRGTPNYIAMLLDISTRDFEKVLYFNSYIVLDPGNLPLLKKQILTEKEYQEYKQKYGEMFKAGMGAEAIKYLLKNLDMTKLIDDLKRKLREKTGSQKQNIIKRIEIAETFLHSKSRPEWMILDVLPVIPPDLRPMVQLDGGRFATSDLNDLYRRVINRNNRLTRLIKLNAPEIIIKNEKRMLQEAVNALIDNGRRGRPVTGPGNRPLKSLNDMLKGKQGRFRQNLLGKRVDYSGRSVIVVGPKLRMHQCGLPQRMALELFKPFIMHKLVEYGLAHNIKSAKRMIEREQNEVWNVLEEVVREHPVMLNRAPTLHRHGIQAFEPVLVQGKAIQIHPLVCAAFNADFDGDQMAVHVPLLLPAKTECRVLLLSAHNQLSPANGHAVASPSQDMAIGTYYLTMPLISKRTVKVTFGKKETESRTSLWAWLKSDKMAVTLAEEIYDKKTRRIIFKRARVVEEEDVKILEKAGIHEVLIYDKVMMESPEEVIVAFETGSLSLHDHVVVKCRTREKGEWVERYEDTTVGRIIFNQIVPPELGFVNKTVDKGTLMGLIERSVSVCGTLRTAQFLDDIKTLGFKYSTRSGLSIGIQDLETPLKKVEILQTAEKKIKQITDRMGTHADPEEWRQQVVDSATDEVTDAMLQYFKAKTEERPFNSVYLMAISGARGNTDQIRQLAGMRGLMANPHGDIIPVPIKANFREGLSMTDYFISTYGARKGLVDTALRTADSGYLTRRLVDVAQDTIVFFDDCGSSKGIFVKPLREKRTPTNLMIDEIIISLKDRIKGRVAAMDVLHPVTGEVLAKAKEPISDDQASAIANSESVVAVSSLREDMVIGEVVTHPKERTIVCGADIAVTPFLRKKIVDAGVTEVKVYPLVRVRSPIHCMARQGVCQRCYGYDLSTSRIVDTGVAVGVIAAQSIGEPGTQLTMRTFHLGGVAVAMKTSIKAKVEGEVVFDELQWQFKTVRGKYMVDVGTTEEMVPRDGEFERNVRKISLGGNVVIRTASGKLERYPIPVGATLKVNAGDRTRAGTVLSDYNPNEVVTAHSGTVFFENILIRDGLNVSQNGVIVIKDGEKVLSEYDAPQRAIIKVEDGDTVVAGDVIAEVALEEKSAIAGREGRIEYSNIKIKNQRVISDNGMVYVVPTDEEEICEVEMPAGVKHSAESLGIQEMPTGALLMVKNGDQVRAGDDLMVIFSELDGVAELTSKKSVSIKSSSPKEYYMTGNLEHELDEENKIVTFTSEVSGRVKIISYRSSSNKTVDRRRVIVKDERVYIIPEGAQLKFDNVFVQTGEDCTANQKITGPIPFVTEVDGKVSFRKLALMDVAQLVATDGVTPEVRASELVGKVLGQDAIVAKTGEILATIGETITEELARAIMDAAEEIGKLQIQRESPQECVVVTSEKGEKEYLIPEGATLKVAEGDTIAAGDQLIEAFAPIEAQTAGKVNYITQYNKHTGEDLIKKIIVYSGRDYFLPVGIPLVVKNGDEVNAGDPLTEKVKYETFKKVDRGIKFTRLEELVKKYYFNDATDVYVAEGEEVKVSKRVAAIRAPTEGVVKVRKATTKSGKVRSLVDRVVIQPGEAHPIVDGAELLVKDGQTVKPGDILAKWGSGGKKTTDIIQGLPRVSELFEIRKPKKEANIAAEYGEVQITGYNISVRGEESQALQYKSSAGATNLLVQNGEIVEPGSRITDGNIDPKKLAKVAGIEATVRYLIDEVQHVYKSQGVSINDRHIEVIVSNMLTKISITKAGDTRFLPGEIVDVFAFRDENAKVLKDKGKPAQGTPMLQGITKASLTTDSFISAASFQETTRILTKAAIKSKVDFLRGLKENIIIGKLIPAGTGLFTNKVRFKFVDEKPEKTEEEKRLAAEDILKPFQDEKILGLTGVVPEAPALPEEEGEIPDGTAEHDAADLGEDVDAEGDAEGDADDLDSIGGPGLGTEPEPEVDPDESPDGGTI
ncbi:MAG: DNA-directed RNA polymerase subunit beta' [Candidatus Riflebacteria bacterium]|nr:DNA-directed RNA polymerase subunit beta' [Candidatus Riflebacteria bacterium]